MRIEQRHELQVRASGGVLKKKVNIFFIFYARVKILFFFCCALVVSFGHSQNNLPKDTAVDYNIKKYTNLLVVMPQLAANTNGFCVKYSGLFRLKKHLRTAIGFSLFIERINPNKNFTLPGGVSEVKIGY